MKKKSLKNDLSRNTWVIKPGYPNQLPGYSSSQKMLKIPGTRVIDTRHWTH